MRACVAPVDASSSSPTLLYPQCICFCIHVQRDLVNSVLIRGRDSGEVEVDENRNIVEGRKRKRTLLHCTATIGVQGLRVCIAEIEAAATAVVHQPLRVTSLLLLRSRRGRVF